MAIELFNNGKHACLMFNDLVDGEKSDAVQANQFLIVSDGEGTLIDPAGNITYNALLLAMNKYFPHKNLKYILASHQDPDIVASLNKWLFGTDAQVYVSRLWERFVPHFTTQDRSVNRLVGIPDKGTVLTLRDTRVFILPAHFLHSEGNFHFYDEKARVLFSGDMGASLVHHSLVEKPITGAAEFKSHIRTMDAFHRRYMVSNKACRLWANMARQLNMDFLVPQHGRYFKGKEAIGAFLDWIEQLQCGIDLFSQDDYRIPA
ncbi:MAG: MBL fold metallo-hydrolase [Betaproteobacteria bacterium]|nr:MBL fold metallo-hydrolase [Betaproteobacteria bacterium]